MTDYRTELFAEYERHTGPMDPTDDSRVEWFRAYAAAHYSKHLSGYDKRNARVLEVGCNKGYLLKALQAAGYMQLAGIDVAEAEVEAARRLVPDATLEAADAWEYLASSPQVFDIIIVKAVLEHIPKGNVVPFLKALKSGLRAGGSLLIDVPNMDWFFASHERYMDFTHEVGFTQESLRQVMGLAFDDVIITPAESTFVSRRMRVRRSFARWVLTTLFAWADGEGVAAPIWARALVAVGKA